MTCLVNLNAAQDIQVVCLSDDGACLNFGRSAFFTDHNIQPAGQWSGRIKTLNQTLEVETPVYKVNARCRNNACVPLFILATEDITFKRMAEDIVIANIDKMLNVNKDYIANPHLDRLGECKLIVEGGPLCCWHPCPEELLHQGHHAGQQCAYQQVGDKRKHRRNEVWRE